MSGLHSEKKTLNLDLKLMQSQRGNDCKMITVGAVLAWLHKNSRIQQAPLPPRFRHIKKHAQKPQDRQLYSLRQVAKHQLAQKQADSKASESRDVNNQVTEAIDDVEVLAQVASHHPEVTAAYVHTENKEHYLRTLKQAIDLNLAPIVFFDVDPETSAPGLFKGSHEHSAIVVAHYQKGRKTYFTLAQWGDTTEVDGDALFQSTQQLRAESRREAYYKYEDRKDEGGKGWIPAAQIHEPTLTFLRDQSHFPKYHDLAGNYQGRESQANTAAHNHGGLRGKILFIVPKKEVALMEQLKQLSSETNEEQVKSNKSFPWFKAFLGLGTAYLLTGSIGAWIIGQVFIGITLSAAPYALGGGVLLGLLLMAWCLQTSRKAESQKPLPAFTGSGPAVGSSQVLGPKPGLIVLPSLSPSPVPYPFSPNLTQ